jgi:predicted AAA+ superfamily ATPase
LIKSPKIYFTDTGLACYLLGIETPEQLQRDPLRGLLFENLLVLELVKARYNQGLDPNLYFYRDSQGKEVDVIYQRGRELIPIEIKSSRTYNTAFLETLLLFRTLAKERVPKSFLIYGGTDGQVQTTTLLSWQRAAEALNV